MIFFSGIGFLPDEKIELGVEGIEGECLSSLPSSDVCRLLFGYI